MILKNKANSDPDPDNSNSFLMITEINKLIE